MRVTVLGCGSSSGVPVIGCGCAVCQSPNPKNQRSRVSVLIEIKGKSLLIDSSPDLRTQALREGINRVDAVFYTHDHADHTQGLDDLRSFNYLADAAIPIYADANTLNSLKSRFPYAFLEKPPIWFCPCLEPRQLPDDDVFEFIYDGITVRCFKQRHGKVSTLGFRVGDVAYSTDVNGLSEDAYNALDGVKVWIVDCQRYAPSFTHADLPMTLGWVARVKPERAILTHMAHEFDYDTLKSELPSGVEPAYDGMQIELTES